MFTKAVKCDAPTCTVFRPVDTPTPIGEDFGAFEGWIQIHVNRPPDYNWTWGDARPVSTLVDSFDCCSIACAREVLRLASDHVPTPEPVEEVSE